MVVVQFDLWRVRPTSADALETALNEAAFRIGQTVAEGLSTAAARRSELLHALAARPAGAAGAQNDPALYGEQIDRRLAAEPRRRTRRRNRSASTPPPVPRRPA